VPIDVLADPGHFRELGGWLARRILSDAPARERRSHWQREKGLHDDGLFGRARRSVDGGC
jgi:hypothetical protein